MRRLLVLLTLAIVVAGCGNSSSKLFSLDKTRNCVAHEGARIGGPLDFIASTATGGAFKAHVGGNVVTVVFGQTEEDARQIEGAYTRAAGRNIGIGDVLARRTNVVLLWNEHPSDEQLGMIADCLK